MQKECMRMYENFCKALDDLLYCRTVDPNGECVLDGAIYRFNKTFNISLKVMADVLINEMGVIDYGIESPKAILKTAHSCNIIKDNIWLSMLETRNDSVCDYDGELAKSSFELIVGAYCDELLSFKDTISRYYDSDHLSSSDVFQN